MRAYFAHKKLNSLQIPPGWNSLLDKTEYSHTFREYKLVGRVHASMSEVHMLGLFPLYLMNLFIQTYNQTAQELLMEREGKRSSKVVENFEQLEKAIVGKLGAEEMLFEPTLRQVILSADNRRFIFGYAVATSLFLGPVWLIEVIVQSFFSKLEIIGFALGHISFMFSFPLIIQLVGILDQMLDFIPNYFPPPRFRSWG
jgi:hypothetical protein